MVTVKTVTPSSERQSTPETEAKHDADAASVKAAIENSKAKHGQVDDADALLREIDSVLEENAAEFVRNYVQKGGQ